MAPNDMLGGFRGLTFLLVIAMFFAGVVFLDLFNYLDPCLFVYLSSFALSMFCGIMFAIWWREKGQPSTVFKWITFLLFSIAFTEAVQAVARYRFIYHVDGYTDILNSVWWQYRSFPKLIALIYLAGFALWQRWGSGSTYHGGIRSDMVNGFDALNAKIVCGEIRFAGHSHEGLVLDAKLIVKPEEE